MTFQLLAPSIFDQRAISSFNFDLSVNVKVFKQALVFDCIDIKSETDLPALFRQTIIEKIVQQKSVDPEFLVRIYGFHSQNDVKDFLKDFSVIESLKSRIQIPKSRLSESLYLTVRETYQRAQQKMQNIQAEDEAFSRVQGSGTLLTLFDIFEFIKQRSDDEISIIENYFQGNDIFSTYTRCSLKTFRDDLKSMPVLDFEEKYSGCYAGLLDNFIKPIIQQEEFFRRISNS